MLASPCAITAPTTHLSNSPAEAAFAIPSYLLGAPHQGFHEVLCSIALLVIAGQQYLTCTILQDIIRQSDNSTRELQVQI